MEESCNCLNVGLSDIFNYKYQIGFDFPSISKEEDYYCGYIYDKFLDAFLDY